MSDISALVKRHERYGLPFPPCEDTERNHPPSNQDEHPLDREPNWAPS